MNWTLASSGSVAMYTNARATCSTSMRCSASTLPVACRRPRAVSSLRLVAALPMSIWPQRCRNGARRQQRGCDTGHSPFRHAGVLSFACPIGPCRRYCSGIARDCCPTRGLNTDCDKLIGERTLLVRVEEALRNGVYNINAIIIYHNHNNANSYNSPIH